MNFDMTDENSVSPNSDKPSSVSSEGKSEMQGAIKRMIDEFESVGLLCPGCEFWNDKETQCQRGDEIPCIAETCAKNARTELEKMKAEIANKALRIDGLQVINERADSLCNLLEGQIASRDATIAELRNRDIDAAGRICRLCYYGPFGGR